MAELIDDDATERSLDLILHHVQKLDQSAFCLCLFDSLLILELVFDSLEEMAVLRGERVTVGEEGDGCADRVTEHTEVFKNYLIITWPRNAPALIQPSSLPCRSSRVG